jgi:hypothetical protein
MLNRILKIFGCLLPQVTILHKNTPFLNNILNYDLSLYVSYLR